ncbi:A-kinase anchor protein 12 isoform X1 [Anolis carolinensis]|uniref:A-kinase anchor protein 12 isoform X1 n=1 Tax=Anolis carolinensis TaxID=28377 RepID=UPI002F2B7619
MGAGSSAEQAGAQDGASAAEEQTPLQQQEQDPEGQAGEAEGPEAEEQQQQDPAKALQKNGQISSLNSIAEEQVDLSLKPDELNGQQAEVIITDVGQRETANVILKEESLENMEARPPESTNNINGDDDQKDVDKQSPSVEQEEQEQPGESPSNDVGFKKVIKLVGFKFTVRKDKTEKVEPVQLLNVKVDDTEVASDGSGDRKEVKKETMEETAQTEVPCSIQKTEQETQTDKMKEESSLEKETESSIEAGSQDAETKNDESKSPTSPLTSETSSPLKKFFTQGWAGFRKRTSFRKPKEEEQQALDKDKQEPEREVTKEEEAIKEELEEEKPIPEKTQADVSVEEEQQALDKEKQEPEREVTKEEEAIKEELEEEKPIPEKAQADVSVEEEQQALDKEKQEPEREVTKEEEAIKEELEEEKPIPEKAQADVSVEGSDKKAEENKEKEGKEMIDVTAETDQKEIAIPHEQLSMQESAEEVDEKSEMNLNEKDDLDLKEKTDPGQESLIVMKQITLESFEEKIEPPHPSENDQSDQATIITTEQHTEQVEETVEEGKPEPKPPLATEIADEEPVEVNIDLSTIVKKDEPKTVLEQSVESDAEIQRSQPTDEQIKDKETVPETVNEQLKQTEPSVVSSKSPEGIKNEVELISSQEKAKMQGSPLKKLFSSSGLKKLSVKKHHKGKKEEAKSGEAAEQTQQFSDSAESPEDPRAESSASSPEEAIESIEKGAEASQVTETEEVSIPNIEKRRESITAWASFKKMVTPKKRIRRLSESDREEEPDKGKSATLSSTESAPCEEQEDIKENAEEQKLEKSTDEPKKKVDTSVSWEALICVGSSKKRTRKSSSSDEEVGQRLAEEGQKTDETAPHKETTGDITLTSSQESDQGQGGSSPELAGSPSEGEGVSTWESFKRLVTARRKSKIKIEERNEDSAIAQSLEYSTSDGESGKEESWVSFKKLMPSRRKKKSDGIPEHKPVQGTGEEITETNEEDSDIPAVVPLSEYEAAEQEKFEAQKINQEDATVKVSDQKTEKSEDALITEQSSEDLVHAVTVTVVEGERAVTSIEERSPSWISAAVTGTIECTDEVEGKQAEQTEPVEETVVAIVQSVVKDAMAYLTTCVEDIVSEQESVVNEVTEVPIQGETKSVPISLESKSSEAFIKPEIKKDISGDTIISELELTSEAVTAREEASGVEEGLEVSCAEETTEMVSAVSRLSESPDTTEIATPVQEVEESHKNLELSKQTQEILQEVAERVKLSEGTEVISKITSEVIIQAASVQKTDQEITLVFKGTELNDESEWTDIQIIEGIESGQKQVEIKESGLKEVLEKSHEMNVELKKGSEEIKTLNQIDECHHSKTKEETLEKPREIAEDQATEVKSQEEEEDFVIVTVTPEEKPKATIEDAAGMQLEQSKKSDSVCSAQEIKMHLEEVAQSKATEDVPKVQELQKATCEEKLSFSQKQEQMASVTPVLDAEPKEITEDDIKKPLEQNEVKDSEFLIQPPPAEKVVPEAPIQSKIIDVPMQDDESQVSDIGMPKAAALGLGTESTKEVGVEASIQNKETEASVENVEIETDIQKIDPEGQLQELQTKMSLQDVKPELNLKTQIHAEMVGKEISERKMDDEKIIQAKDSIQKAETNGHIEKVEDMCQILSGGAEVLAENSELKVDVGLPREKTKTEFITEKAGVEEHIKETEAHLCPEEMAVESDAEKVAKEMALPMPEVKSEILKEKMELEPPTEKLKTAASKEKEDVKVHVKVVTEKIGADIKAEVPTEKTSARVEAEICAEKVDAKVDAKSSTEKADVMLDGDILTPSKSTDENLKKELPSTRTDMELLVEKVDAGIVKINEIEVPPVKEDIRHSTEEPEVEASIEKAEAETQQNKTDVGPLLEEADLEVISGKGQAKVCEKESKEMVEEGAPAKQPELNEIIQKVEMEAIVQTVVKDAMAYLTCAEDIVSEQESVVNEMTEVPIQGETKSVPISLESKSSEASITVHLKNKGEDAALALEEISTEQSATQQQGVLEISTLTQDKVDHTQIVVADANLKLESQITEGIEAEAGKSNDLKNNTVMELKSTKETITDIPMQIENITLPMKEEKPLESLGTTALEDSVQNEKKGIIISDSKDMALNVIEVTGDSLEKEVAVETESAGTIINEPVSTEVDRGILTSDSGSLKSLASDDILENVRNSNSAEPTEVSDSCQTGQALSEKTPVMETEKSSENIQLAGGYVLHAAPVQQEIFADQQEVVTMNIPEVQNYATHKSSVTVTATDLEEQGCTEKVTLTERSAETPQALLEATTETAFQVIQQVSVDHLGLGAPGTETGSEKTNSEAEEPVSSTPSSTKVDIPSKSEFESIPEMKLQKSETSQEDEKPVASPASRPSLTHIEFEKDVVQSVTIASESTKIILKIIQNVVDKLEKTEEPALSSQSEQTETCSLQADKSEIQGDLQKQEAFKATEEMPVSPDKPEIERSSSTRKTASDLEEIKHTSQADEQSHTLTTLVEDSGSMSETVKEIIKEKSLQKENGEPKCQSAVDTVLPSQSKRAALESVITGHLPKESLEADQPKLKDMDVGQVQEQLIQQQMPLKTKEEHSSSTGFMEIHSEIDVNNQDCASHESPQLKLELTES